MKNVLIIALILILTPLEISAAVVRDIQFPVDGMVSFRDDFGEPRAGHSHEGNDLMGEKMTPLVAAVDGYVSYIVIPEANWGYSFTLKDSDGYSYHYLHVNNDTPGTDDGNGGLEHAYVSGLRRGSRVTKGQLLGWMGDSGNAEWTGSHLHFEIRKNRVAINPYESLMAAGRMGTYSATVARASVSTIDDDRGLRKISNNTVCVGGSLIKLASSSALYYCGADGKRYAFPNQRIYDSWYDDFSNVQTYSLEEMAMIRLGGNVTYRPGARMIKILSDPKVYAVEKGGVLRWVTTPDIAEQLYGNDWADQVDDISDAFFFNYTIGDPITSVVE